MDKIYTVKGTSATYILQKLTSLNKTFTLKSILGVQNLFYKKWLRWIKYIL